MGSALCRSTKTAPCPPADDGAAQKARICWFCTNQFRTWALRMPFPVDEPKPWPWIIEITRAPFDTAPYKKALVAIRARRFCRVNQGADQLPTHLFEAFWAVTQARLSANKYPVHRHVDVVTCPSDNLSLIGGLTAIIRLTSGNFTLRGAWTTWFLKQSGSHSSLQRETQIALVLRFASFIFDFSDFCGLYFNLKLFVGRLNQRDQRFWLSCGRTQFVMWQGTWKNWNQYLNYL